MNYKRLKVRVSHNEGFYIQTPEHLWTAQLDRALKDKKNNPWPLPTDHKIFTRPQDYSAKFVD